ncbi:rubrerythrin [Gottschalkia acidurici 9a]|uniref:Rubrerythrin n=1 Tax=Gottschalkia acidurici (strain ATCC 7906 / DSM 604 / BCRC 14475 / CIP 104303 / KCTC 5404 / NCIMB 10678 / 9a) TaxID=1128398 RepID=K0B102_GOTA9|nr:ferritin family protein [Gottschalkia acidurici]AFS79194.1 rubrerythrin [Gottschalkia acidurici 9a]
MNELTAENLRSAFGGESQAHMRYKSWGEKAKQDGFPKVQILFEAISYAEEIHAKSHFRVLKDVKGEFEVTSGGAFGLGTTSENLELAAAGERFEVMEMYPGFIKEAKENGEKGAVRSMELALEAEKTHEALYLKAKEYTDSGKDIDFENIHVCEVCGYTSHGEMVDKCPICNVGNDKFRVFK